MDTNKCILVTGIGGNVAQGIIRNIRSYKSDIRIIGTNVTHFSPGNHLVDKFYKVSFAYEANYIQEIISIVEKENVHMIIPSTDFEVYYLIKNQSIINAKIIGADEYTCETYLDKYKSAIHHQKYNIPFAKTVLPSVYNNEFQNIIVKPRLGRGSRGIHVNPTDLSAFSDEEFIVQKLHKGKEITTAFYVDKSNKLHGSITMSRKLENGMTVESCVEKAYDDQVNNLLKTLIQTVQFRGAANLQSIVDDGTMEIIPFEINCRISGTNSIRSNFGFKDVEYILDEYLFETEPQKPIVTNGIATRIMMDVIYPNATSINDCQDNASNFHIF